MSYPTYPTFNLSTDPLSYIIVSRPRAHADHGPSSIPLDRICHLSPFTRCRRPSKKSRRHLGLLINPVLPYPIQPEAHQPYLLNLSLLLTYHPVLIVDSQSSHRVAVQRIQTLAQEVINNTTQVTNLELPLSLKRVITTVI